jgi:acyl-homoserine-lactone acylase
MPVRREGFDWTQYLPGDRSDLIWTQYHPLSSMPIYIDPDSGWVLSTNQTPFDATELSSNLDRDNYSATYGIPDRMSNRAWRSLSLMRALDMVSRDDLLRIKFDKDYSPQSAVGVVVAEVLAMDLSGEPELEEAQDVLAEWDLSTNVENNQAALGVLLAVRTVGNLHTNDPWLMDPKIALEAAATELRENYGRLDPEWGEVNRVVRGDVDMAVGGGPDVMRAIYGAHQSLDEDGRIHAAAGDTSMMLVEWGPDGSLTADAIHHFGATAQNVSSPHHNDQVPLFVAEEWRRISNDFPDGGYHPSDAH